MFKIIKYSLPLLVFSLLIFFLWRGLTLKPEVIPSALIGQPVPAFSLPQLLIKEKFFTEKEFIGKITILNVWASWCFACRQEHPYLEQLEYLPGITLYGLNYKDEPEQAQRWLKQFGNPYHKIAVDQHGRVAIDFGVYGTPETFIIDQYAIIRYRHVGPIDEKIVHYEILPLLKKLQDEK